MGAKRPKGPVRRHLAELRRVGREGVIEQPEEFVRAIDFFTHQAKRDPAFAAAVGREFFRMELLSVSESIRHFPKELGNYLRRAEIRNALGDRPGALEDLLRVIRRDPRCREAYLRRMNLRWNAGDVAGATADCSRAVHLTPRGAPERRRLSRLLERLRRPGK